MKLIISMLVFGVLFTGCANMFKYRPYARNVKKKSMKSGVVALKVENRKEDQDLAMTMMQQNCRSKKVDVLEEGEVQVGTITKGSRSRSEGKKSNLFGMAFTTRSGAENTNTETVAKKEWHITYRCK